MVYLKVHKIFKKIHDSMIKFYLRNQVQQTKSHNCFYHKAQNRFNLFCKIIIKTNINPIKSTRL